MVKALKHKDIDVIYRGLTPGEITGFQKAGAEGSDAIELNEMVGTEIRYLVFNPKYKWAGNKAVRKAIAQLIDRKALVRNVYHHTADALYSMVPATITGHTTAFYDVYGDPSQAKAQSILRDAGIDQEDPADPLVHHGPLRHDDEEPSSRSCSASSTGPGSST